MLEPVPHCTVGVVDAPAGLQAMALAELRAGLGPLLPIRCEARAATLLEERGDRTWSAHARFPFEGAA